jgi:hypothetical protein
MSGSIPLLPLYAFMPLTGRTLPFLQVFNTLSESLMQAEHLTNIGMFVRKQTFLHPEVPSCYAETAG